MNDEEAIKDTAERVVDVILNHGNLEEAIKILCAAKEKIRVVVSKDVENAKLVLDRLNRISSELEKI